VRLRFLTAAGFVLLSGIGAPARAETYPQSLFAEMRWRCIGPFRGGRTVGGVGVPGKPGVFYAGVNNGGVWETDDYGRTWRPIFDGQPTQSIGAIAVAPSDANVIYAGSGEGLQRPDLSVGDGVYRSTDAGKTWKHGGLRDAQQIAAIVVDPRDPKRLLVAALGHPYGPNEERGVFRSTDGGETFAKSLYKDSDTGAVAIALDPKDPDTVYAVLWAHRLAPWENGAWRGKGNGLFKSRDAGKSWRAIDKGLPTFEEGLGRIGVAVAPSDPTRLYALVELGGEEKGGLYASDDAGESWRLVTSESRVVGRGSDFAEAKVDPWNRDVVYVANTCTYRSTDGGKTFAAWKGAPGGDDYHTIWIDPTRPDVILLASDQGATLTVNGGRTWSSWYNQPTAQLYHVSTDNRFPYWVYGGQQESGSVGIASRGDDGAITFRDWHPVGAEEYGYIAVDPLNPDLVYGGKLSRFSHATREVQDVSPAPLRGRYRFLRTAPVLFSPTDPHVLYYAGNVLFKTTNGGLSWDVISPDLTREKAEVPASVGASAAPELAKDLERRRGVIYTVAPSPKDGNLIWAGTDDGLIHVTRDGGKTWSDVTPKSLGSWAKVSLIEASHFDPATAYTAINAIRLDDVKPHVLATRDYGKTWTEIVKGLPDAPVNAVREDPVRRGLLYAGTERGVDVSFDDGASWQSLRLNLPATSVRDLVVHGNDLVVGTHGRSFWILDDVTPLRQMTGDVARADVHLFAPAPAYRIRRSKSTDTPLPPEEPAGENPPDGAVIDYLTGGGARGPVILEFLDAKGTVLRLFSSEDAPEPIDPKEYSIPEYWMRPPRVLSSAPGMHRFVWNLHLPPPAALEREFPISAIVHDTPREPLGPTVLPGTYSVRLTAAGKSETRPLTVKLDPRITTAPKDLERRFALAVEIADAMKRDADALERVRALRKKLAPELDAEAAALEGSGSGRRRARGEGERDLKRLNADLTTLYQIVEGAEAAATSQAEASVKETRAALDVALAKVSELAKRAGAK
jgi:photosystem II stability/assembly factor-like uncharacterized protein